MDTKDLSPAFFTSLGCIFLAAILIGTDASALVIFGWLLLLAGLCLNVFSSLVSIQRLKGGPLPALISEANDDDEEAPVTEEPEVEEPAVDTETQQVITLEETPAPEPSEEKIFRTRAPRTRNR